MSYTFPIHDRSAAERALALILLVYPDLTPGPTASVNTTAQLVTAAVSAPTATTPAFADLLANVPHQMMVLLTLDAAPGGVTMDEVAQRCGIHRRALKDALLQEGRKKVQAQDFLYRRGWVYRPGRLRGYELLPAGHAFMRSLTPEQRAAITV